MTRFVYVTYIRTTPEKLWRALTGPEFIHRYWGGVRAKSDFRRGSPWSLTLPDGRLADTGEILEADPPHRLVIDWRHQLMPEIAAEGPSRCVFELEPTGEIVKLTVSHEIDREPSKLVEAVSTGWPGILASLKSLLETGEELPFPPAAPPK